MDLTALFRLSYGLYVVGVKTPDGLGGCVVDSVAQVASGEPPKLILSCRKPNYTNALIKAEMEFTLSVLSEKTDPFVVSNFGFQSARDADKWPNVPHTLKDGLPVLDGAASYVRCRVGEIRELETHTLFICDVVDAWNGEADAKPLIFAEYQRTMKNAAREAFNAFKAGKIPASGAKWRCSVCGYTHGGPEPFEKLPADWLCPICGVGKDKFEKT
jgi:flavin reductase (DIM6/NTAB) family NADH-FMN oxidoreductase RutF/rubredoxin